MPQRLFNQTACPPEDEEHYKQLHQPGSVPLSLPFHLFIFPCAFILHHSGVIRGILLFLEAHFMRHEALYGQEFGVFLGCSGEAPAYEC